MRRIFLLVITSVVAVYSSSAQSNTDNYLYRCNEKLVEIIMEDLFTPPVASRVQVYPNIAAWEVLCFKDKKLRSMAGQLNGLSRIAAPDKDVDLSLSALTAFTSLSRRLIYSEYMIDSFQKEETKKWLALNKNDTTLLNNSVAYGRQSADQLFSWVKKDNYDFTRTLSRYVVVDSAGAWQPTAPDYGNAIEPNWWLLRSFVFDSATMIKGAPPTKYSEQKNSAFYKSAIQVYTQSKKKDTLYRLIASYWDCNPNITKSGGHFTYYIHKISPGGHWIRITGQAVKNLAMDESNAAKNYLLVSLGLYEGFLSCWTDKFNYNTIRPETYINKLISPRWKPYIETPPFLNTQAGTA